MQLAEYKNKQQTPDGFTVIVSKGRKMAVKFGAVLSTYSKTIRTKSVYKENHSCYTQSVEIVTDNGHPRKGVKRSEWSASFTFDGKTSSNIWDFYA